MKGLHKIRQKWNDSKLGRNDISVRIYLSFVVVLAVSLLLTGAIFNYLYQRNYTRFYTELLTKQGKKIARRVSKFQYKKNIGQYEKYSVYIDEIESAENTDVWILSNHKAKNALKEDFTNAEMNDDNLTDDNLTDEMYAVLRQAFGGQTGASSSYDKAYGMMILRVAIPVHDYKTDQVIGAVMMVSMIDRQTMGLREGKYLIFLSAVVAVVISYLIALIFTKYLSLPINKIGKTIRRIAGGDYSPVEKYSHSRQLSQLEEQLDVLAERLTKAEQERANLEQVRRDFFANVSHELKTPLMSISGYAELMMNGMVRPENIADFSGRIYKEANRLGNLVADIIQLSRLDEQQDAVVSMESVELDELAKDVVNNLRDHAEKKNISLDYCGIPINIQGVRHVLYEMLYNIADNAVRYTNPGGHIHIYVGRKGNRPFYRVEDDGIGIPKSEQKRIFERFYRVDKSHSRQTGGTGLGLSIVKHGATLHHAQINVDSDLGKGTKMELLF